jgi:hypothetical protein
MHHSDDPRKLPLSVTCYCDDSGTHDQSRVAVVGAILMNKPRFTEFYVEWRKILKEFRIDGIHMTDFVRPYGRYCSMRSEMKKALFASAAKAINQKKEYSVSVAVPQADYTTLMTVAVCKELMGPYAMAFFTLALINRTCSQTRNYNNKIAYLIDKGINRHHEQLQGAHTVMLHLEKQQDGGRRFTGAMAADIDDNNFALQAADVVAWSYHRRLESPEFGDEFSPLLSIFKDSQIPKRPDGAVLRPHVEHEIPTEGVLIFAALINQWLASTGEVPSWGKIIESSDQMERDKSLMTPQAYTKFDRTMTDLFKIQYDILKNKLNTKGEPKR